MKKVLVLPFLRMPSGHHQVAEAVINMLSEHTNDLVINKMDLFHYTSAKLERVFTKSYLSWINYAPRTYEWVYKHFVYSGTPTKVKWYFYLFLAKMKQLLEEEQPDLIICTHGFPSLLLGHLKRKGKLQTPVVNVYTDFFVNKVWGKQGIDAHFVPNRQIKDRLVNEFHIPEKKIFVTGIPVHGDFREEQHHSVLGKGRKKILVSGGSSGLGNILTMLNEVKESKGYDYIVLCGNNQKLYQEISSWRLSHIYPVSYLSSRTDMNALYNQVDAIITKPGGVTVSEALQKRLPIFINSALPGQEEINLRHLKQKGLVFELNRKETFENQLFQVLNNQSELSNLYERMDAYHQGMEMKDSESMVKIIRSLLDRKSYVRARSSLMDKLYPTFVGRKTSTGGNTN